MNVNGNNNGDEKMAKSTVKTSVNFHSIVVTKTLGPKRTFKVRFGYSGISVESMNITADESKRLNRIAFAAHQTVKGANYGDVAVVIAKALEDAK